MGSRAEWDSIRWYALISHKFWRSCRALSRWVPLLSPVHLYGDFRIDYALCNHYLLVAATVNRDHRWSAEVLLMPASSQIDRDGDNQRGIQAVHRRRNGNGLYQYACTYWLPRSQTEPY